MTLLTAAITLLSLAVSSVAQANDIRAVAPALETYTHDRLFGEVWKRPGLSPHDRSVLTLAVLIARHQTVEMPYYINLALDYGGQAGGNLRDHYASRVLLEVGQRHGGGRGNAECLCEAKERQRPTATRLA